MSVQPKSHLERRGRTSTLIENMLDERRELLDLLCKVSGRAPFTEQQPDVQLLERFCQILVDYIAAGHFGLYERIALGTERRRPVVDVAEKIYPEISKTTQLAVDFNERYEKIDQSIDLTRLERDLLKLGEVITKRIALEDRLIDAMLGEPITMPEYLTLH